MSVLIVLIVYKISMKKTYLYYEIQKTLWFKNSFYLKIIKPAVVISMLTYGKLNMGMTFWYDCLSFCILACNNYLKNNCTKHYKWLIFSFWGNALISGFTTVSLNKNTKRIYDNFCLNMLLCKPWSLLYCSILLTLH